MSLHDWLTVIPAPQRKAGASLLHELHGPGTFVSNVGQGTKVEVTFGDKCMKVWASEVEVIGNFSDAIMDDEEVKVVEREKQRRQEEQRKKKEEVRSGEERSDEALRIPR